MKNSTIHPTRSNSVSTVDFDAVISRVLHLSSAFVYTYPVVMKARNVELKRIHADTCAAF